MPWWGWIVVGVMLLGAEMIVTTDFYLAVLGMAALSVALVSALGLETPWTQWALFGALSIGYLVAFRARISDRLGRSDPHVPLIEGDFAVVQEAIEPGAIGQAELHGARWTALNKGRTVLAAGARVRVEKTDGLTIHVRSEADLEEELWKL